jgi:hypothetical protein
VLESHTSRSYYGYLLFFPVKIEIPGLPTAGIIPFGANTMQPVLAPIAYPVQQPQPQPQPQDTFYATNILPHYLGYIINSCKELITIEAFNLSRRLTYDEIGMIVGHIMYQVPHEHYMHVSNVLCEYAERTGILYIPPPPPQHFYNTYYHAPRNTHASYNQKSSRRILPQNTEYYAECVSPASTVLPSTVVPSAVLPSTVVPSAVLPSTVVPSTVVPSAVVPSTVVPSAVVPSEVVQDAAPVESIQEAVSAEAVSAEAVPEDIQEIASIEAKSPEPEPEITTQIESPCSSKAAKKKITVASTNSAVSNIEEALARRDQYACESMHIRRNRLVYDGKGFKHFPISAFNKWKIYDHCYNYYAFINTRFDAQYVGSYVIFKNGQQKSIIKNEADATNHIMTRYIDGYSFSSFHFPFPMYAFKIEETPIPYDEYVKTYGTASMPEQRGEIRKEPKKKSKQKPEPQATSQSNQEPPQEPKEPTIPTVDDSSEDAAEKPTGWKWILFSGFCSRRGRRPV